MAGEVDRYLDLHPFRQDAENWDQASWDERSAIIDMAFHQPDVIFTPLIGSSMIMPTGIGWDQYWYTGAEIRPSHINHTPIGRYQRMMGPIYFDTRQRRVRARDRWGAKAQWDVRDQMVTRYGNDTDSFIAAALRGQLAANIVGQTEKIARDGLIQNALHVFDYQGNTFVAGTRDFSNLPDTVDGIFDLQLLEDVALRLATRCENTLKQWGNYAQPVPGENFRSSVLILATTGTWWDWWQSEEQRWMIDLRQLQDERIINGGKVQYRNFATIVDTGSNQMLLHNAGNITRQVAVTSPIRWGDGAPDPETTAVDNMFYAGQSGTEVTHYVQCSDLGASQFVKGDFVSIHIARYAATDYGIADGVNFLHGKTYVAEVYSVDEDNERLTFRDPITEQYEDAFAYTTLANVAAAGNAYAFVTKATHVAPVMVIGTREGVQFVQRRQPDGTLVQYNRPVDNNVDFPSVERVTANWYGEVNPWQLDNYEIFYVNAAWANRGAPEY